ncbi:hypothetical protein MMC13_000037 [Lambiella insularis]|nr:hypothetical protein [Lambiella insularis]
MSTDTGAPIQGNGISADQYDHAINLVDTTKSSLDLSPSRTNDSAVAGQSSTIRNSDGTLSKKWTKGTLREGLARRKYAKYQERDDNGEEKDDPDAGEREGGVIGTSEDMQNKKGFARENRFLNRIPFRSKKKTKLRKQQDYEVDILYENQRGSFLCGIPLYSSKSLLNFDPSAWQTAAFQESPVDITNAQLPDPTWAWAWKSWYVDMSHDVDEEGWEYSFSFRHGFSWHGNHPWFHSFVRRRRWLRKRLKIHPQNQGKSQEKGGAHMLNADYFTIHSMRARSRGSSAGRSADNRSSRYSNNHGEDDSEEEDEEITNTLALMKALKKATVDRRKTEAIINFLDHGGDDLHYLPDRMHEIMGMFLYQTSRQQLLSKMQDIFNSRAKHRQEHEKNGRPESEEEKARTDALLKAVEAADEHVKDLKYWSDVKKVEGEERNSESGHRAGSLSVATDGVNRRDEDPDIGKEIKGIPNSAGVDEKPGINWDLHQDELDSPKPKSKKGKEKAVD